MNNANKKQNAKKEQKRRIIIISCIVIALLALVALIYNVSILARNNSRNRALQEQINQIQEEIGSIQDEIDWRNSPEFIEDFARNYLQMQRPDESIFIAR